MYEDTAVAKKSISAVASAAASLTDLHQRLAAKAKQQDQAHAAWRAREIRVARRQTAEFNRRMRLRVDRALEGITALCATGNLPEVQSLITSVGPLCIWVRTHTGSPGGDMSDITYGYESRITLSASALIVEYHTWSLSSFRSGRIIDPDLVFLSFPYADTRTWRRLIAEIATEHAIDWEDFDFLANGEVTAYISPDVLFEIIVECSNAQKLERYFLEAISASRSFERAA